MKIAILILLGIVGIIATTSTMACQVPVFRYALERWDAENYRLIVMHRKPLPPAIHDELLSLQKFLTSKPPQANVSLEVINVDKISEQAQWSLPGIKSMQSDPWLVLLSPDGNKTVYSTPLTPGATQSILNSPTRKKWLSHILSGASVVWIVIPGNDHNTSKNPLSLLQSALSKAEKSIKIPEGVYRPEDLKNNHVNDVDREDVLRSPIPLKISFPILTLNRSDPKEAAFFAMLTQGMPAEMKQQTLFVPLFARGRMLQPLPASRATEDIILRGCSYLCGACSCTVKDNNPGIDIIIQQNWQNHLQNGLIVIDKELPPLEGVGDLTKSQTSQPSPSPPPPATSPRPLLSPKYLFYAGSAILLILLLGTLAIKRKSTN